MPTLKTEGIVLDAIRVSEADRLITFFTPDLGRIRARARGISRTQSKYGAAAELFAHDRFQLYSRSEHPDTYTMTECTVADARAEIRADLTRLAVATFVADVCMGFTGQHDPLPEMWDLLNEAAALLSHAENVAPLPWAFQFHALSALGHLPDLTACQGCGKAYEKGAAYFDPAQGGIVCKSCRPDQARTFLVNGSTLRLINQLFETDLAGALALDWTPRAAAECRTLLQLHAEHQLDWRARSMEFLKSTLG